uniref:Putative ovule protein n=1 Tax=Solanum chacoense TaxID=4108 RepID=A0A0V0ICE8_SOLCH
MSCNFNHSSKRYKTSFLPTDEIIPPCQSLVSKSTPAQQLNSKPIGVNYMNILYIYLFYYFFLK